MLNTPKDLIVQGRKATRPNLFHLDTFLFTAHFSQFEIIFPQTCPLILLLYLSCNLGKSRFFIVGLYSREELGFSFAGW